MTCPFSSSSIFLAPDRYLCFLGVLPVSKVLYGYDLVPGRKFEARGDSEEEILAAAADHIATVQYMTNISDGMLAVVCAAMQEEVRTCTRAAGA